VLAYTVEGTSGAAPRIGYVRSAEDVGVGSPGA